MNSLFVVWAGLFAMNVGMRHDFGSVKLLSADFFIIHFDEFEAVR